MMKCQSPRAAAQKLNIDMDIQTITIAGRRIAADEPPYVIAEMSANHNGNIETAFKIIEAAKQAGADAVNSSSTNLSGPHW